MEDLPHPVALVEDDEAFVVALCRLLTAVGIATVSFSSAEAFLTSVRTNQFSCLVLDVHLPGVSGLELLDRLDREQVRLPVILMSADVSVLARNKAFRLPVMGCLQKPLEGTVLVSLLRQAAHLNEPQLPIPESVLP